MLNIQIKKLQIDVEATKYPKLTINNDGALFVLEGTFLFTIVPENIKAFIANVYLKLNTKLNVIDFNNGRRFNLTGQNALNGFEFRFTLKESFIGDINLSGFQSFINIVVGRGMVPQYNRDLQVGISLPIELPEGLSLNAIKVDYNQHYFGGSANIRYIVPGVDKKSFITNIIDTITSKFVELLEKKS